MSAELSLDPSRSGADVGLERFVRVRGAREHNLQNVDVDIPRNAVVVFSGVSGSGKSSLAFGTLYAEAQRRYFESVAPYARRLIDQVGVPDVDAIEGLPPAVALQQQRGTPSARSSLGTVTTLSSLLRLLYSRAGNYPPRQPMLYAEDFSPNTPAGACPQCHGLGHVYDVTEALMVPDPSRSIRDRAIAAWPPAWHGQNLRDILVSLGHDVDTPWHNLPKKQRDWILYTDEQPTVPVYAGFTPAETREAVRRGTEPSYQGTFTGVRRYVMQTFATSQSARMKERASRFMTGSVCSLCQGRRLKPESLAVTFAGVDIGTLSAMPLTAVAQLLRDAAAGRVAATPTTDVLPQRRTSAKAAAERVAQGGSAHSAAPDVRRTPNLSPEKLIAAQRITHDVLSRIDTLLTMGLGYLTLERATPTLSPGELQRVRLATQIRSNLFGVIYVLDEPSAGLHPADSEALHDALDQLKAAGNTLFVVEHDLALMRRADWLVDVGPEAGTGGGEVLYSGPPAGLATVARSVTARYLYPKAGAAPSELRTPRRASGQLALRGIGRNNLRGLDIDLPLGVLTTVTGVSGSGKSSLISQALVTLLERHLGTEGGLRDRADDEPGDAAPTAGRPLLGHLASGAEQVRRLVRVDQKPIGRTPRSNPATYTGLFDEVRALFASTRQARTRHFGADRFSFNLPKGRCATCEGEGFVSVEMLFMPSVYAPCPTCHGARYNAATLAVKWEGHSIADVLDLTVDAALTFFAGVPRLAASLQVLQSIGLGYLRLGQPATELSGGEAQRIKLATELQRARRGGTLYVLDEPTTGLHAADVDRLLAQLDALVETGNTVILVEHDMRVAARSDWVVDMGPGAGAQGGQVVVQGTPQHVAQSRESRTGPYLREAMREHPGSP